jgi:Rrf2 family protein
MTAAEIAKQQNIPAKYLGTLLIDLKRAGYLKASRGFKGGYQLAMDPDQIVIANLFRALEGPIARVAGERPDEREYSDPAKHIQDLWIIARAAIRKVLENVTLKDLLEGTFNDFCAELLKDPESWKSHFI